MINILAVGNKDESWIISGLQRYQRRLKAPWNVKWHLVAHAAGDAHSARRNESATLLARLDRFRSPFVVLLDERGQQLSSPALAKKLDQQLATSQEIVIIIGGAYGVTDELRQRVNFVWSLSELVFPHQLVRLILIEQLYRAQEIAANRPYHHQ